MLENDLKGDNMIHVSLYCHCNYDDCELEGPKENVNKLLKALCEFEQNLVNVLQNKNQDAFRKGLKIDYDLIVNSGYRCARHNADVGGVKNSQHRYGLAADIKIRQLTSEALFIEARNSGLFRGIGLYNTFIHVDMRGNKNTTARWDRRSAKRKAALPIKLR